MTTVPKQGDRVTYGKYAGQKVTINGVRLLLLNDDEITSILPEEVDVTSYIAT
jgi:co-chaperonin GroES (HSP10)